MSEAIRQTVIASILDYMAAWNEPKVARRLQILERCWAEDAGYVDPNVELRGRAALCEHIAEVHAGRPGAPHVVRFFRRLVDAGGGFGETSIDFGEVDARGKLTRSSVSSARRPGASLAAPSQIAC
jgi:hypothetical protein